MAPGLSDMVACIDRVADGTTLSPILAVVPDAVADLILAAWPMA